MVFFVVVVLEVSLDVVDEAGLPKRSSKVTLLELNVVLVVLLAELLELVVELAGVADVVAALTEPDAPSTSAITKTSILLLKLTIRRPFI